MFAREKQTGGNALKHYNLLDIEMKRLSDNNWPTSREDITPNSFVVQLKLEKTKIMGRYRGNSILMYFKEGKFEHKFNVLAISKDLGLHDGKTLEYKVISPDPIKDEGVELTREFKAKGFNDMYNRIPDEAIAWLENEIPITYTKQVLDYIPAEVETGGPEQLVSGLK
jgi:hypothetical protein